jgi:hypothetical protein
VSLFLYIPLLIFNSSPDPFVPICALQFLFLYPFLFSFPPIPSCLILLSSSPVLKFDFCSFPQNCSPLPLTLLASSRNINIEEFQGPSRHPPYSSPNRFFYEFCRMFQAGGISYLWAYNKCRFLVISYLWAFNKSR